MKQITINVKDSSKLSFLMQLIQQLDFVEIVNVKKERQSDKYDFFSSAGLWAHRDIDAKDLREKAWKRKT